MSEATRFFRQLTSARMPSEVLTRFSDLVSRKYPGSYGQLWINDANDPLGPALLLVHEWGNTSSTSVAPIHYRLRHGDGIVGAVYQSGLNRTQDMSNEEEFNRAAAPDLVRQEKLGEIDVRNLRGRPSGALMFALRSGQGMIAPNELDELESLASLTLARYMELKGHQIGLAIEDILGNLQRSSSERDLLTSALAKLHVEFESDFSVIIQYYRAARSINVIGSIPLSANAGWIEHTPTILSLINRMAPTRLFSISDSAPRDLLGGEPDNNITEIVAQLRPSMDEKARMLACPIPGSAEIGVADTVVMFFRDPDRPGFLPIDSIGLDRVCHKLSLVIGHTRKILSQATLLDHAIDVTGARDLPDIVKSVVNALEDRCSPLALMIGMVSGDGELGKWDYDLTPIQYRELLPDAELSFPSIIVNALENRAIQCHVETSFIQRVDPHLDSGEIVLPIVRWGIALGFIYLQVPAPIIEGIRDDLSRLTIFSDHLAIAVSEDQLLSETDRLRDRVVGQRALLGLPSSIELLRSAVERSSQKVLRECDKLYALSESESQLQALSEARREMVEHVRELRHAVDLASSVLIPFRSDGAFHVRADSLSAVASQAVDWVNTSSSTEVILSFDANAEVEGLKQERALELGSFLLALLGAASLHAEAVLEMTVEREVSGSTPNGRCVAAVRWTAAGGKLYRPDEADVEILQHRGVLLDATCEIIEFRHGQVGLACHIDVSEE